jgi:hypothetical protein
MAEELGPDDPRYIPDDLVEKMSEERSMLYPELTDEAYANKLFREHAAAAASTIAQIAMHGSTERVRFDAAKYITERVLGPVAQGGGTSDPLAELFKAVSEKAEQYANQGSTDRSED